jgi:hypothetical protein
MSKFVLTALFLMAAATQSVAQQEMSALGPKADIDAL